MVYRDESGSQESASTVTLLSYKRSMFPNMISGEMVGKRDLNSSLVLALLISQGLTKQSFF